MLKQLDTSAQLGWSRRPIGDEETRQTYPLAQHVHRGAIASQPVVAIRVKVSHGHQVGVADRPIHLQLLHQRERQACIPAQQPSTRWVLSSGSPKDLDQPVQRLIEGIRQRDGPAAMREVQGILRMPA